MNGKTFSVARGFATLAIPLCLIVSIAIWIRAIADDAGKYIKPYIGTYYSDQIQVLANLPWWKLFLPLKSFEGRWGTTGFLLVNWLEVKFGEPVTFYLLTAVFVASGFIVTFLVFRSVRMATLVGIGLASTTFNYHVYAVSGSVIMLPLISFLFLFTYCQIQWIKSLTQSVFWTVASLVSLLLFALSYEGWLDLVPSAWIIYPVLAWHFRRTGDRMRSIRCVLLLGVVTLFAALYVAIKAHSGLGQLHPVGGEADLIFTYGHQYRILMLEDVLSSFFTFFYTTISTYFPPQFFSYSLSSWIYGPSKIVALQEGYHPVATHLTHYNHMFLWRYYAGFALAFFLMGYKRVIAGLFKVGDNHHLILFVLMTCVLVGSPTHLIIKWRPMHSAPFLGYQCYLSIMAFTVLICYWVFHKSQQLSKAKGLLLTAFLIVNFFDCAYARPSLLSHMSQESFLGAYPDPRINLSRH